MWSDKEYSMKCPIIIMEDHRSTAMADCTGFIGILSPEWYEYGNDGMASLEEAIELDLPIVLCSRWEGVQYLVPDLFANHQGIKLEVEAWDWDELEAKYVAFFMANGAMPDGNEEPRFGFTQ